eukprot:3936526-Rhodomonas_salina.1
MDGRIFAVGGSEYTQQRIYATGFAPPPQPRFQTRSRHFAVRGGGCVLKSTESLQPAMAAGPFPPLPLPPPVSFHPPPSSSSCFPPPPPYAPARPCPVLAYHMGAFSLRACTMHHARFHAVLPHTRCPPTHRTANPALPRHKSRQPSPHSLHAHPSLRLLPPTPAS